MSTTAAASTPQPLGMGEVFRITALRRMWYAQVVSVFGDFLALFAVISVLTFKLHATAQQVTGIQIAYLLPIAVLGVLSGVFIDRWPLKSTLVASDLVRAVLCLLLVTVHGTWGYYGTLAAISVVSSFFSPAQGVAVRSIVPLHGLRSANALLQQAFFVMRIVGPSAAPFLVAKLGANSCYLIDAVSFAASASFIATVTLKVSAEPVAGQPEAADASLVAPQKTSGAVARVFEDMKAGGSFILHHAALLFVILALSAAMFVMACFGPLIALYVRDNLQASTRTFGVVSGMIGIGLMVGVNGLNAFAKGVRNTTQVYLGLIGIALGTLLMAAVPQLWSAVLGCLLVGSTAAGVIVPTQVLMQTETPPELMGRVGSTLMSVMTAAQIGGLLLSGVLANHLSVRGVFALCSLLLILLAAAGKLFMEPKDPTAAPAV